MTPLAFSLEATFAEGGMPVATATARYDAFRRHGAGLVPVGAPDTGVLESLQWAYAYAAGRAGSLTHPATRPVLPEPRASRCVGA